MMAQADRRDAENAEVAQRLEFIQKKRIAAKNVFAAQHLLLSAAALAAVPYSHFPAFCSFLIFRLTISRFKGLILSRNTIPSQ